MGTALAYANTAEAVRIHVDAADKQSVSLGLRGKPPILVNEAGLYSLIFGSKQIAAKEFKRWVTSEVLPAIRRNGGYMTPEVAVMATESPAVFLARALPKASESGKSKALIGRVPKYVFYENNGE